MVFSEDDVQTLVDKFSFWNIDEMEARKTTIFGLQKRIHEARTQLLANQDAMDIKFVQLVRALLETAPRIPSPSNAAMYAYISDVMPEIDPENNDETMNKRLKALHDITSSHREAQVEPGEDVDLLAIPVQEVVMVDSSEESNIASHIGTQIESATFSASLSALVTPIRTALSLVQQQPSQRFWLADADSPTKGHLLYSHINCLLPQQHITATFMSNMVIPLSFRTCRPDVAVLGPYETASILPKYAPDLTLSTFRRFLGQLRSQVVQAHTNDETNAILPALRALERNSTSIAFTYLHQGRSWAMIRLEVDRQAGTGVISVEDPVHDGRSREHNELLDVVAYAFKYIIQLLPLDNLPPPHAWCVRDDPSNMPRCSVEDSGVLVALRLMDYHNKRRSRLDSSPKDLRLLLCQHLFPLPVDDDEDMYGPTTPPKRSTDHKPKMSSGMQSFSAAGPSPPIAGSENADAQPAEVQRPFIHPSPPSNQQSAAVWKDGFNKDCVDRGWGRLLSHQSARPACLFYAGAQDPQTPTTDITGLRAWSVLLKVRLFDACLVGSRLFLLYQPGLSDCRTVSCARLYNPQRIGAVQGYVTLLPSQLLLKWQDANNTQGFIDFESQAMPEVLQDLGALAARLKGQMAELLQGSILHHRRGNLDHDKTAEMFTTPHILDPLSFPREMRQWKMLTQAGS